MRGSGGVCGAFVCLLLAACSGSDPRTISVDPAPSGPVDTPTGQLPKVMDTRPATLAAAPPPAITGGTLLVTKDAQLAVAADPDRDLVSIVSIPQRTVLHTVRLKDGDQPGRLVEDKDGRV